MAARKSRGKAPKRKPKARPVRAPFPIPAGWSLDQGGKSMSFRLQTKDFLEAVAIINAVVPVAEALEHHPDFHLEEWNKLRITTWSHDVGGLTDRDERLAKRINEVVQGRLGRAG